MLTVHGQYPLPREEDFMRYFANSYYALSTPTSILYRTGDWGPSGEYENYKRYFLILLTDLGAVHSLLSELDPAFITCHDFSRLGDPAQANMLANFVAPSAHMAKAMTDSLIESVQKVHNHVTGEVEPNTQRTTVARLQRKLDTMETLFCN